MGRIREEIFHHVTTNPPPFYSPLRLIVVVSAFTTMFMAVPVPTKVRAAKVNSAKM